MSNVLIPLDGSELAERAIQFGVYLARLTDAGIKIVRAAQLPPVNDGPLAAPFMVQEACHEYLTQQASRLAQNGLKVSQRTGLGAAAEHRDRHRVDDRPLHRHAGLRVLGARPGVRRHMPVLPAEVHGC